MSGFTMLASSFWKDELYGVTAFTLPFLGRFGSKCSADTEDPCSRL
jgi:hypothetical protein